MKFIFLLILIGFSSASSAASIIVSEASVEIGGTLENKDLDAVIEALNKEQVKKVIFKNCTGGIVSIADTIAFIIKVRDLSTEATGIVASSCALAFLSSRDKKFNRNTAGKNLIILHGSIKPNGEPSDSTNRYIKKSLIEYSGGKVSVDLIDLIINSSGDSDGLFLSDQQISINGRPTHSVICGKNIKIETGNSCRAVYNIAPEDFSIK